MYDRLLKILKFVLTPHNPRNVALWVWHQMLSARAFVALYRWLWLPRTTLSKRNKQKLRVVFLPMNVAMWRYEYVYRRMLEDPRFEPLIVTAPRIIQPRESYVLEQREMLEYFKGKGHNVIAGFDESNGRWIDLAEMRPDLIFYTQPYDGMLPASFEYWHNLSSLICFTPYSFQFSKIGWNWDNALQNYAWLHFLPLAHHIQLCREFSRIRAENAVSVGYFFEEQYQEELKNTKLVDQRWRNDSRKRIIWAPHHSLKKDSTFATSAFLDICDDMLALRERFKNKVIFAFKPHPMLRNNLYEIWGRERTDAYYADWASSKDSFFDDGEFVSLFAGSDAMIHCSGSFIVDYIYTGKPVQYYYCKERIAPDFGEIGDESLNAHYSAHTPQDVERFIQDVVMDGNDYMRDQRESVYQNHLTTQCGKLFSENVVDAILLNLS